MAVPEELEEIISQLKALAVPANISGMARFGINPNNTLGVSMPNIRQVGMRKKNHDLALALWDTGIHEARILASIIDQPAQLTSEQMDSWTADFDSWDVCDQVCGNLYSRSPLAVEKALFWAKSDQEFVKRAGFALMAYIAVHGKKVPDVVFIQFLGIIESSAEDGRNFVKKAVNWALRQIGKRGGELYQPALEVSKRLALSADKTARWIGTDAVKELLAPSNYVKNRLGN
jgi:3-methyladenine DNA glycosylase AlkD